MRKIDYSKRGPLIKVQIGPGRFVKMYERDAIARGLVKKERPQVENKMMVPEEEKSTPSPSSRPSPTGEGEEKRKRKRSATGDREVGGSIPVTQVDEEKTTPQTETPHPDLLPREKETLEGDMEG
ncbi:MAG TPA: hypothetical protein DDW19_01870 [Anaerolineaceae bacterium]|jgi:hypothetical protein|nr:hypothetical protein [Anaerolineaceae bacterium]